jgi:hypothetical protein
MLRLAEANEKEVLAVFLAGGRRGIIPMISGLKLSFEVLALIEYGCTSMF